VHYITGDDSDIDYLFDLFNQIKHNQVHSNVEIIFEFDLKTNLREYLI
jgi:hypothetical protein